jgi:BirA family biotin operon repressor/biotin-[acetyl-CoA-carboxylase] ligase
MTFGWPHRHYARTDSTNTRARELAAAGAPHGTVVTAAEQTEGRGRQGRSWSAPAGGALLYSAVVRPLEARHMTLPLAVPLAVCEVAERLRSGVACGLKWPNDVQVEGRKLAGVLVEARPQDGWAVIGVGLNLTISPDRFPPDLRDTATSLFPEPQTPSAPPAAPEQPRLLSPRGLQKAGGVLVASAREALDEALGRWVEAEQAEVIAAWRERDVLRGRQVAWDGGSGIADGIDDRGYLVVVTPGGGRVVVGAGEVHLSVG